MIGTVIVRIEIERAVSQVGRRAPGAQQRDRGNDSRGRHGGPEERSDQEDSSHGEEQIWKADLQLLRKKSDDEIFEELLSLDGVGLKTAACVLVFLLGRDVFPVDTHIHRICNHLGLTPNCKTPENTFERMKVVVPKGRAYTFHINLIRLGREVCKARNPLCGNCPLYGDCEWGEKVRLAAASRLTKRGKDTDFILLDDV